MAAQPPVFTTFNECQDCYKCVRHCHAKAIRIENGHAAVIQDACVACGECVRVCPAHAKKIRSDISRLLQMLEGDKPVYASVAPSWLAYFPDWTPGMLIQALKRLGFAGVSETARGAQLVSAATATFLREHPEGLWLSGACPASVDYIRKYHPRLADRIVPVDSPVQAHCKELRARFGDIRIVFFGPCAAKKNEADRHPDVLSLACTFPHLEELLRSREITPDPAAEGAFDLGPAEEGRAYSFEGGMNDTLRDPDGPVDRYFAVSGLQNLDRFTREQDPEHGPLHFVEMLACEGGCVNGPAMRPGACTHEALARTDAFARVGRATSVGRDVPVDLFQTYAQAALPEAAPPPEKLRAALESVGKFTLEDELNCGACGYDSCRDFAAALVAGKAEPSMCHTFLRKNFERKSSALIKYIPAGVVIVDQDLRILECNALFVDLMGPDARTIYDSLHNLEGVDLSRNFPFASLFTSILRNGGETAKFSQPWGKMLVNVSVFSITPGKVAGAVVQDVTRTEIHREEIAERARELIRKNVRTVQEVAKLFGEHIAESEILLTQIAGNYSDRDALDGTPAHHDKGPAQ